MKRAEYLTLFLMLAIALYACVPAKREKVGQLNLEFYPDFNQGTHQILYAFQDKLQSDSLYPFFNHPNEELRYFAVHAFASIKDKEALPRLIPMLKDSSFAVRNAAAFAIGQLGDVRGERPLSEAFVNYDTVPGFQTLNATILEAIGKCGSAASLKLIAETSTYLPTDTILLLGQMRALFRYGQRNLFQESATQTSVKLLTNQSIPFEVRQMAGIYLFRFDQADATAYLEQIKQTQELEQDPRLQMYLFPLVIRYGGENGMVLLEQLFKQNDEDYRIKINSLRQLKNLPPSRVQPFLNQLLKEGHPQFAPIAAEYYVENGSQDKADYYLQFIDSIPDQALEAKIVMLAAAGRWANPSVRGSHTRVASALNEIVLDKNHSLPNRRIAVLAMGYCLECLVPLKNLLVDDKEEIVLRSAAAEGLGTLAALSNFSLFFRSAATEVKVFIAKYLSLSILEPEDGLVAPAAYAIINPTAGLRLYVSDTINWSRIRQSLVLPAQAEDYASLLALEDFLENKKSASTWSPPFNNPIDWDRLRKVSDTTQAIIKTPKGSITIQLYKKKAPATVLAFINLAEQNFYVGKSFHRVVPNFVIQGGCTRGDGYGSLDFSLRSELGYGYFDDEGYMGMASAGNHTESQQFFITHSPTPHLDGNYTIFGKVIEGMDIVHKISRGDVIDAIVISY